VQGHSDPLPLQADSLPSRISVLVHATNDSTKGAGKCCRSKQATKRAVPGRPKMAGLAVAASAATVALFQFQPSLSGSRFAPVAAPAASFRTQACGLRCWIAAKLKLRKALKRHGWHLQRNLDARRNDKLPDHLEAALLTENRTHRNMHHAYDSGGEMASASSVFLDGSSMQQGPNPSEIRSPVLNEESSMSNGHYNSEPSLCIAVIGATGELARNKVFPALFALYYSGFLPQNVGIFGYSRKKITDEDLRAIIEANLTCRVDHHENCDDKLNEFLKRTYYIDAGHDNKDGMSRLNSRMAQIEVELFVTVFESFGEHSCFIFELEILFMKFINIHFCFTGYSCSKQNILPCCSPRGTS